MLIYDKKDGAIDLYRLDEKDNKVAKLKKMFYKAIKIVIYFMA